MYSQQELDDAVAEGVISAAAADALRAHVERQRSIAIPDEEQFRLITGFNDIFVSIAAAILLFAVGWIGQSIGQSTGLVMDINGPSPLAPLECEARRFQWNSADRRCGCRWRIVMIVKSAGLRRHEIEGLATLPRGQRAKIDLRAVGVIRMWIGSHVMTTSILIHEEHARAGRNGQLFRRDAARRQRKRVGVGRICRWRWCGTTAAARRKKQHEDQDEDHHSS